MLRRCPVRHFITKIAKISKPPMSGYEISELPNEQVLQDFVRHHRERLVLTILHSGLPRLQEDHVVSSFVATLNMQNFGHPSQVAFALVPGPQAPILVDQNAVLGFPTTLLLWNGKVFERVVGARSRELSIKSLFKLRNEGRNIFSRE